MLYKGAAGGVAGIIAGQPLDVVRVRLQQKAPNAKGVASMWQHIVRQEGMRSLFKGAAYPITTIAMQVMRCLSSLTSSLLTFCDSAVPASTCSAYCQQCLTQMVLSLLCLQTAKCSARKYCYLVCLLAAGRAAVFLSYGVDIFCAC